MPLTHPYPHWIVVKAQAAGVEIIGDIELFVRERAHIAPDRCFVAITGTNGKSTTTALVAHLYQTFGYEVEVGGNIGTPILALNPPRQRPCPCDRVLVVPDRSCAVAQSILRRLLNITVDHLDRHGTMEHYAEIKERLVAKADVAIIGVDDDICAGIAQKLRAQGRTDRADLHPSSGDSGRHRAGRHATRPQDHRPASPIADLAGIPSLRGTHNGQNAAAAVAALGTHGFELELVQKGLQTFPGLAHRMEEIGQRGKVLYINDSKATNADAAEKALQSLDDIYWILGGRAKEGGIGPLSRSSIRSPKPI